MGVGIPGSGRPARRAGGRDGRDRPRPVPGGRPAAVRRRAGRRTPRGGRDVRRRAYRGAGPGSDRRGDHRRGRSGAGHPAAGRPDAAGRADGGSDGRARGLPGPAHSHHHRTPDHRGGRRRPGRGQLPDGHLHQLLQPDGPVRGGRAVRNRFARNTIRGQRDRTGGCRCAGPRRGPDGAAERRQCRTAGCHIGVRTRDALARAGWPGHHGPAGGGRAPARATVGLAARRPRRPLVRAGAHG